MDGAVQAEQQLSPELVLWRAREYVERGFSVIPLGYRGKRPVVDWKEFQSRLPTDAELVSWFRDEPRNIGIVTGSISGVDVVDCDSDAAIDLAIEKGLPGGPIVRTSRGMHFYFRHEPGLGNFQKRDDLPGIDLRAEGGYVVAPPSIHESGVQYAWEGEVSQLQALPRWILARQPASNVVKTPIASLYDGVVEGSRNDSLARLVGSWAAVMPIEAALAASNWWGSRCRPAMDPREIERTVRSIYAKEFAKRAELDKAGWTRDPIPADSHLSPEARKRESAAPVLQSLGEFLAESTQPPDWLIDGLLPRGGLLLLIAKPKVGKSTLSCDAVFCLATRQPFLSRRIFAEDRPIIHLALEEHPAHLREQYRRTGIPDDAQVFVHVGPAPENAVEWLAEIVRVHRPSLVIIDPLMRLLRARDANDYAEITRRMEPLLPIARDTSTALMLLHHAGKGDREVDDASLGSQAFYGSVDVLMHLNRRPDGIRTVMTRQRYGEDIEETVVEMEPETGLVAIGGAFAEVRQDVMADRIRAFLKRKSGPVSEPDIREAVGGDRVVVSAALRRAVAERLVFRSGQGRRGSPFLYFAAEESKC